eukprot:1137421-Pelagomonas_calceolata.AAC.3
MEGWTHSGMSPQGAHGEQGRKERLSTNMKRKKKIMKGFARLVWPHPLRKGSRTRGAQTCLQPCSRPGCMHAVVSLIEC